MKQILLKGPGYSGRGVRLHVLSTTQVDTIREEAAKNIPNDESLSSEAKQQIWVNAQKRAGIAAMVAEVTERANLSSRDELQKVGWKKLSVDELTESPEKYFTTKDLDALGDIYFRLHVAQPKEIENILGEAQDVTAA